MCTLKHLVRTLGRLPAKSTALGRVLHEWREALIADLGGHALERREKLSHIAVS